MRRAVGVEAPALDRSGVVLDGMPMLSVLA
jgi:hypothetical protein